jgi:hypothetical protein
MKRSHKIRKKLRKAKVILRGQEDKYFTTRRLKEFEKYTGEKIMPHVFDLLQGNKRVRLLDIGAGSNQIIRDVERELRRFDKLEETNLSKKFRGVGLSLTDLSLPSYYRYALSGKEADLKDAYRNYFSSAQPGERLTYPEFKDEMKKPASSSLGFARGYLRGDIEKAFERAKLPKFDLITSHFALRYVPDILYVLEGIHNRLLTNGGKAFLDLSFGRSSFWGKKGSYKTLETVIKELNAKSDSIFTVRRNSSFLDHFILKIEKKADKIKFPYKFIDVEVEKARTISQGTVKRKYKETGRRRTKKKS